MRALCDARPGAVAARLDRIVNSGRPQSVDIIADVVHHRGARVAEIIVRALAELEGPVVEAILIDALDHHVHSVQLEAATGLTRTGIVRAVAPLGDWARRKLFSRELQKAARQAIAAIQSRIAGATPGELSLVNSEGGDLSFAHEDRRGQMSLDTSRDDRS